ncbi:MAG: ABC transporter substrate-binding protein [archaeon]
MNNYFLNKKVLISVVIICVFIIFIILGFFYFKQPETKSIGEITYGYQNWPGVLPYLIAYDQGFFNEKGLKVNLVKEESYVKEIENLTLGKTDFVGDIALIDVVKEVSHGNNLKVVLATDYSNRADGIVARKDIDMVSKLKGKRVAVEEGTLGEYLLYDALKKNNLSLSDLKIVNLSAQEGAQAFIRGEVDAAVTYEPDLSQAVAGGNGLRPYTSLSSPGLIIDVLAFRPDFVAKNPDKVSAVVSAYIKAMDFFNANPEKSYIIGANYFGITPAEFKDQLAGIKLMNKEDNNLAMSYKTSVESLHGAVIQANEFLKNKGTIKDNVDSIEIIDPKFIRELNK